MRVIRGGQWALVGDTPDATLTRAEHAAELDRLAAEEKAAVVARAAEAEASRQARLQRRAALKTARKAADRQAVEDVEAGWAAARA